MKNIFVIILLISHINSTMFFPVVDESRPHAKASVQQDAINSVMEYVDEVVMGNTDTTTDDDKGDNPDYYHITKSVQYLSAPIITTIKADVFTTGIEKAYASQPVRPLSVISYDIVVPPPKA